MNRERMLEIQSGIYAVLAGALGIATISLADLPWWLEVGSAAGLLIAPGLLVSHYAKRHSRIELEGRRNG